MSATNGTVCDGCVLASWKRTASGKLHPSKEGKCLWKYEPVVLPASLYWIGSGIPTPCGGRIERGEAHRPCPHYRLAVVVAVKP